MNMNTFEVMNTLCHQWHGYGWKYSHSEYDWDKGLQTVVCIATDVFPHIGF